jgi:hypothetical protein
VLRSKGLTMTRPHRAGAERGGDTRDSCDTGGTAPPATSTPADTAIHDLLRECVSRKTHYVNLYPLALTRCETWAVSRCAFWRFLSLLTRLDGHAVTGMPVAS